MNRRRFTLSSLPLIFICISASLVHAQASRQQLNDALIAAIKDRDTQAALAALKAGADANTHDVFQVPPPRPDTRLFFTQPSTSRPLPKDQPQDKRPTIVSVPALYLAVGWRINTGEFKERDRRTWLQVIYPPVFMEVPREPSPQTAALIKALLDAGANPNEKNPFCHSLWAPLFDMKDANSIRLLVDGGADTHGCETAMLALNIEHSAPEFKMLSLLLEKGADVNTSDQRGMTALVWATLWGNDACVRLLLDKSADINAQDKDGKTALMWAIIGNRLEEVKMILARHADVTLKDHGGHRALFCAYNPDKPEIIRLLKQAGAKE